MSIGKHSARGRSAFSNAGKQERRRLDCGGTSVLSAVACALWVCAFAAPSQAAIQYLVSDLGSAPTGVIQMNPNTSSYSQFTLTGPGNLGVSVTAVLKDAGGGTLASSGNFSASIVNNNSGVPGGTTVAASTGDSGIALSTSSYSPVVFNFVAQTIPAGTYWLELAHANVAEDPVDWGTFTVPSNTSSDDGTVNTLVYTDGSTDAVAASYGVTGTAAPVPEPASLAALGIPAAMALLHRRRKQS